ncbi:S4 domain-containing protein [Brevibacillus daliensis]|uniref:S4 domain-containing protein n=1 Tax=Brevibacillus daliensis TaxID=2892995 RepID=UPI001E37D157|nr:S4 domain-containing protein [Brevibacillus daliensis]
MSTHKINWSLHEATAQLKIRRYCKNCSDTVLFTDTMIRRHNANGKNIFRFAIYKCERDHTWNKKLAVYKAFTDHVLESDFMQEHAGKTGKRHVAESFPTMHNDIAWLGSTVNLSWLQQAGISQLHISLEEVIGAHRLDKVLAERFTDWSRAQITEKIKSGQILVNQTCTKPSKKMVAKDCITIVLTCDT